MAEFYIYVCLEIFSRGGELWRKEGRIELKLSEVKTISSWIGRSFNESFIEL